MSKIYNLSEYCEQKPWRLLDPRNDNLYPALIKDEANYNNEARFMINKNVVIGKLSRKKYGQFWTLGSKKLITAKDIVEASKIAKKIDSSFNNFVLVSKAKIDKNLPDHIELKASGRHESGYIYSTKKIAHMHSARHATFRRYVKKFKNIYENDLQIEVHRDDGDSKHNKELLNLYHDWLDFAGLSEHDLEEETLSFMNYLNLRDSGAYRKPYKIIVRYKGKIVGISINDIVSKDSAINFYMFSNLNLTGISHFIFHETNRHLREMGIKELNFQEDLGDIGLRQFKKRLRPISVYEMADVATSLIK